MEDKDYEWADSKFNPDSHAAVYTYDYKGRLFIDSIYGKNKLQIFYYNLLLRIRRFKRKLNKWNI